MQIEGADTQRRKPIEVKAAMFQLSWLQKSFPFMCECIWKCCRIRLCSLITQILPLGSENIPKQPSKASGDLLSLEATLLPTRKTNFGKHKPFD